MSTKVVFFHGLESGPHGSKYKALKGAFGDVLAPSFEGLDEVAARLRLMSQTSEMYVSRSRPVRRSADDA